VQPFEAAQKEPRDGLLNEEELTAAIQDLTSVAALIKSETDKEYLAKIMQTLTSRIVPTMSDNDKVNINLNEFVFFRRAAIAWQ